MEVRRPNWRYSVMKSPPKNDEYHADLRFEPVTKFKKSGSQKVALVFLHLFGLSEPPIATGGKSFSWRGGRGVGWDGVRRNFPVGKSTSLWFPHSPAHAHILEATYEPQAKQCATSGCIRNTWNGQPGEVCCR